MQGKSRQPSCRVSTWNERQRKELRRQAGIAVSCKVANAEEAKRRANLALRKVLVSLLFFSRLITRRNTGSGPIYYSSYNTYTSNKKCSSGYTPSRCTSRDSPFSFLLVLLLLFSFLFFCCCCCFVLSVVGIDRWVTPIPSLCLLRSFVRSFVYIVFGAPAA